MENNNNELMNRIHEYSLEEIMGERFARYAKSIIQDRAIPDVRDGLKPVQRRILYGMYHDHNTYDKPYRKCAKTVGMVMGNYHPHGDSSIYDAMIRMSQWWKQSTPYIDVHGNNGSMDGDSAAAMRYTECRLAKISNELLKDIDKNTVSWAPNFDDTELEPTVLPVKYPNLLVNGANGISAGYATNIPPHNLGEVIDATIKRLDNPNCRLETIMDIIPGPDFPTGGIVEGKQGIIDAFKTGRGKVVVRSKVDYVKDKGKEQLIVSEIPFDVNKAMLVKRIDDIRIDKKIDGIQEVRDESDREGLRIAIDLKKGANKDLVLNYLYKNSDLQISYAYNMVAIKDKCPKELGILEILDASIEYQREIIEKRTRFDLEAFKNDMHIAEGLIKAISILDEVIKLIRSSKDKGDAKDNLVKKFDFTEKQAEAIVTLQLYRLTNTDIVTLEEKVKNLQIIINSLQAILDDPEKLKDVMKTELKKIKTEYAVPRRTLIKDEITEIKIDTTDLIVKEDVMVVVTHEGYVKQVSIRSYSSAQNEETGVKDLDYPIGIYEMNTMDTLLLFTNMGNYLYVPVHILPDMKWKELGKHISNIIKINPDEKIIASIPVKDFDNRQVALFTKNGAGKTTALSEFKVARYSKPMMAMKLKSNDQVVSVGLNKKYVFISTVHGYGLWFNMSDIPLSGTHSGGVKAISLKNDEVVDANLFDEAEYLTVITDKATYKRTKLSNFEIATRAHRGLQLVRDVKTNPYYIMHTYTESNRAEIGIVSDKIDYIKITEAPIMDRYSTGSSIGISNIIDTFIKYDMNKKEEKVIEETPKEVSLSDVDERIMTIDDFLDDVEK
jgi:topoisomerase-4 subunit A